MSEGDPLVLTESVIASAREEVELGKRRRHTSAGHHREALVIADAIDKSGPCIDECLFVGIGEAPAGAVIAHAHLVGTCDAARIAGRVA